MASPAASAWWASRRGRPARRARAPAARARWSATGGRAASPPRPRPGRSRAGTRPRLARRAASRGDALLELRRPPHPRSPRAATARASAARSRRRRAAAAPARRSRAARARTASRTLSGSAPAGRERLGHVERVAAGARGERVGVDAVRAGERRPPPPRDSGSSASR